jgi:hypothetical protein
MSESSNDPRKEWCPFATMELAKCQKACNELYDQNRKLLEFVKRLNEIPFDPKKPELVFNSIKLGALVLLNEIGESE